MLPPFPPASPIIKIHSQQVTLPRPIQRLYLTRTSTTPHWHTTVASLVSVELNSHHRSLTRPWATVPSSPALLATLGATHNLQELTQDFQEQDFHQQDTQEPSQLHHSHIQATTISSWEVVSPDLWTICTNSNQYEPNKNVNFQIHRVN